MPLLRSITCFLAMCLLGLGAMSPAQALELAPPQLRLGFHARTEEAPLRGVVHLVFPDLVQETNSHLYAGGVWRLTDRTTVETLVGTSLAADHSSPILSLRGERVSPKTYCWLDLEYAPLAHHNLYAYLTTGWVVGPVVMGVDTEDWVNLMRAEGAPVDYSWSVGPSVGVTVGDHLYLGGAALWAGDVVIPRTYFHLGF